MTAPEARPPRTAGGTVHATRQQLDELDALLQRMLDLPVRPGEEPDPVEAARRALSASYPPAEPDSRAAGYQTRGPSNPSPQTPPLPEPPPPAGPEAAGHDLPASRGYPASYMIVETSTPVFPPADDPSAPDTPAEMPSRSEAPGYEPPIPGGRHDLDTDDEEEQLARLRARLEQQGEWVPFRSSWQPSEQTWKPLAENWGQTHGTPATPAPPAVPPPTLGSPPEPEPEPAAPNPARPQTPELHRTPVSMDMPWSLGPSSQGAAPGKWVPTPPGGGGSAWDASPPPAAPQVPPVPPPFQNQGFVPSRHRPAVLLPVVWFNAAFDAVLYPLGPAGAWLRGDSGRTFLGTAGLICLAAAAALVVADGIGWTH